jgi:GNAT superfamily N-acetyltransferase
MASIIALKRLKEDPEYYHKEYGYIELQKAKPTKYISKKSDGKGGWTYTYKESVKKEKKTEKTINDLEKEYEKKGIKIDLHDRKDTIRLSRIIVPKEKRNQGIGTKFMNDLIYIANREKKIITLTPSGDFGGNVKKLKTFYKNFGFIENKGRNKDFSISDTYYKEPNSSNMTKAKPNNKIVMKKLFDKKTKRYKYRRVNKDVNPE